MQPALFALGRWGAADATTPILPLVEREAEDVVPHVLFSLSSNFYVDHRGPTIDVVMILGRDAARSGALSGLGGVALLNVIGTAAFVATGAGFIALPRLSAGRRSPSDDEIENPISIACASRSSRARAASSSPSRHR